LFNALQIASSIGNQDERREISPATISVKLSGFPDAGVRWPCRDARRGFEKPEALSLPLAVSSNRG
jgi:hypothetical protein